jgi:NADH-quinone oxidoreductase subunit M
VIAATGVILSAVYMLWMFQRVMFGPITHAENEKLSDLTLRERLSFVPLVVLIFVMGFVPQPFLNRMQPSLDRVLELSRERAQRTAAMAAAPAPGATSVVVPQAKPRAAASAVSGPVADEGGSR